MDLASVPFTVPHAGVCVGGTEKSAFPPRLFVLKAGCVTAKTLFLSAPFALHQHTQPLLAFLPPFAGSINENTY
jgi:hypothetical protein